MDTSLRDRNVLRFGPMSTSLKSSLISLSILRQAVGLLLSRETPTRKAAAAGRPTAAARRKSIDAMLKCDRLLGNKCCLNL